MKEKKFFEKIDFNKRWEEGDWEKFFQAQDAYRLAIQTKEIRKKPVARIRFKGTDEVEAFEPVIREYGLFAVPHLFNEISEKAFREETEAEPDHLSPADGDTHFWREGAPLANVVIYRDCCRFAICVANELEKYLKRRGPSYRKKFGAEFESLRFHANWVAINVAEGHRLGYAKDRFKGNIAKCLRALRHADTCLGLLSRISLRTSSAILRVDLFSFTFQLRNALFAWVDELRSRTTE